VKLLGGVVMSKARRAAYIGSREERRDVAGMMATSRARRVQASPSWLLRRKGEVRSRGGHVCSGWLAGVVCSAYGDDADVGVLVGVASCRRSWRACRPTAMSGVWVGVRRYWWRRGRCWVAVCTRGVGGVLGLVIMCNGMLVLGQVLLSSTKGRV
jgi:hypothetical protein